MGASDYILGVRHHIGHDLLLLPVVAALIFDDAHRLLLVRTTDTGRWQTVGGAVDPDEHPAAAAVREAKEETGLDVGIDRILTAVGGPDMRLTYPNGDQCSVVSIVYEAHVVEGVARPDHDETSEVGWFTLDEVDRLDLDRANRRLLAAALPVLGFS